MTEDQRVKYGDYNSMLDENKRMDRAMNMPGDPACKDPLLWYKKQLVSLTLIISRQYSLKNPQQKWANLERQLYTAMHAQFNDELDWHRCGKPYFKIDPLLLPHFMRLKGDIPCEHVELPHKSFVIYLPENTIREYDGAPYLRSLLVCVNTPEELEQSADFMQPLFPNKKMDRPGCRVLMFRMDFGREPLEEQEGAHVLPDKPCHVFYRLYLNDGATLFTAKGIDEKFQDTIFGYMPKADFVKELMKIFIGTSMVALHNEEMMSPDLPRKLRYRYNSAKNKNDKQSLENIENKRIKLGMGKGWVVGLEDKDRTIIATHQKGERGELSYSHLRSGHFRLQPTGSRSNPVYKLIFIKQLRVRPDLPMSPATAK